MKIFIKSHSLKSILIFIVLMFIFDSVDANPFREIRQKRTSDQRLAELESLMTLGKLRGKIVTVPIGFDRVDPEKAGRRRRSSVEYDLRKLRTFLRRAERDSDSVNEDNDEFIPSYWLGDRYSDDIEDQ